VTAAQAVFALALAAVVLGVIAFGVVVIRSAVRTGGGPYPSRELAGRLLRVPEERGETNRWAFYLHRITGVAILAFLCLHVLDVGVWTLSRPVFDELHELYATAPLRVFECGLLVAILFHTLNGLRIVAIDAADLGPAAAGRLLAGVLALTALLGAAGSVVILAPLVS
jgi:succinate dehydrogenase / fumarate reductase, cytochrome b subunit